MERVLVIHITPRITLSENQGRKPAELATSSTYSKQASKRFTLFPLHCFSERMRCMHTQLCTCMFDFAARLRTARGGDDHKNPPADESTPSSKMLYGTMVLPNLRSIPLISGHFS